MKRIPHQKLGILVGALILALGAALFGSATVTADPGGPPADCEEPCDD